MMWTIPVTMETKGLLAVLILIIYCITMRKTISVTSMITGFSAPPVRRGFSTFDFLVICWFTYFSWYIFRTFDLLMHNSSPTFFLFYCMPLHLLSLPCFSCSVNYHQKTTVQYVYKDIKIYIFLCLPLQFESVYCCFKGFMYFFWKKSKRHAQSPLLAFLSFKCILKRKLIVFSIYICFLFFSRCHLCLCSSCWLSCFLQTDTFSVHIKDEYTIHKLNISEMLASIGLKSQFFITTYLQKVLANRTEKMQSKVDMQTMVWYIAVQ